MKPEVWHRQVYDGPRYGLRPFPRTLPRGESDLLVSGWTNLDPASDHAFSGLVGSHILSVKGEVPIPKWVPDIDGYGGVRRFTKDQIRAYDFDLRRAYQGKRTFRACHADENGDVVVPPGHALVFLQSLIHCVTKRASPPLPSLRMYHTIRVSRETVPLFDIDRVVENAATPRIPNGQMPQLYETLHWSQWQTSKYRYYRWTETTLRSSFYFRPYGAPYVTPGNVDTDRAGVLGHYLPSLASAGVWTEEYEYSASDRAVLTPQPFRS